MGRVGQGEVGGGDLGILLAGVVDRQHLYRVNLDAINENIVGMNHGFACAGDATGAVHIGVIGQAIGAMPDRSTNAFGCCRVACLYIVDDAFKLPQRFWLP